MTEDEAKCDTCVPGRCGASLADRLSCRLVAAAQRLAVLARRGPRRRPDEGDDGTGAASLRAGRISRPPDPPLCPGAPPNVALEHPDPRRRAQAISVLAEFGGDRAALLVRDALLDGAAEVRIAAARAASRLADDRLCLPLIVALDDDDPDVRRAAAQSLAERYGLEVSVAALQSDATRRDSVAELKAGWRARRLSQLANGQGDGCE